MSSSNNPQDCRFGIELTKELNTYNVVGRPQAWRMKITVTDYFNVDPNIFMFMRTGIDALTGEPQAAFQCVASPTDMEETPAGIPAEPEEGSSDSPVLFFRLPEVDLISRNQAILEETWNLIVKDRDELIRTLEHMCVTDVAAVDRGGRFAADEQPILIEP